MQLFQLSCAFELEASGGWSVQLTSPSPIETHCNSNPPCSCFSLSHTLDAVSHLLQRLSNVISLWSQLLWVFFFLGPPLGGAHSLYVYYVRSPCLDPQPFSAKFHQQSCSFSRRPTACWNLESIKQPAGGGDRGKEGGKVGGREGQVKSGGWGRKETEYKQDTPHASALHPIQPPSLKDHSPRRFSSFLLCLSKSFFNGS